MEKDTCFLWKMEKDDGSNRTAKSRIRTLGEKKSYKYLEIFEADTVKQVEMKEKIRKVPQTKETVSRNQTLQQKSHHRDKHMDGPSCKILRINLKMDKRRT